MQKVAEFLRIKEWFTSKCALMIGIFLYCCLKSGWTDTSGFWVAVTCYTVFVSLFLAFGYVINDFCDREIDRLAGKKKIITSMTQKTCIAILVIMVIGAACPMLIVGKSETGLVLAVLFTILLGTFYSAPPLRFKEKGIWGLIVSSAAQRCMPLWVMYEFIPVNIRDFVLWELLSFFIGLRYILIHQRIDAENDMKTGTVTFAMQHIKIVSLGIYLAFIIEIACLIFLFAPWSNILAVLCFFIMFVYLIWQGIVIKKKLGENMFLTFSCVPLEDLYNFFIPVAFSVGLMRYTWTGSLFLIFFVLVMWKFQWNKWKLLFFNI